MADLQTLDLSLLCVFDVVALSKYAESVPAPPRLAPMAREAGPVPGVGA